MDVKLLSESAQKKVMSYNWPGNVCELKISNTAECCDEFGKCD